MFRRLACDASYYLCAFVVGCVGLWLSDDGSVEQRSGIIGSDVHGQVALKSENRSMSV